MPAVFFDIDGTLFDTRADLAATVNHTRRDFSLAELPVETVITHVGQGARYLLEHSIPEAKIPYEELWEIFRSHYAEHCCETVVPYPNVRRTLDELKARGWLLGVNTNKPNFAVKLILEKFGMSLHVLTHHEECRLDAVAVQRIENPRGDLGNRTVVEGQIDRVVALVDAPHGLGEYHSIDEGRTFN